MQNNLNQSPSLYLQQHANQPIHWQLWGDDVLALAQKTNKPLFFSIGYSACHWCHVMAHEVFDDEQVADFMNQHFIPIKIDREEYPTIDMIYQKSIAILGIQGGWPLSIFATPAGKPFWGGTYFPLDDNHGRPGFKRIISAIHHHWHEKQQDVLTSADNITDAIKQLSDIKAHTYSLDVQHINGIIMQIKNHLDLTDGGIGNAPKFPQSQPFEFIMRHAGEVKTDDMLNDWLTLTFDKICLGGLYDHLAGGFYRYATDKIWLVPHFEKMLYDNALICHLLLQYQPNNSIYQPAIIQTLNFFMDNMQHDKGGFYAALDADSEGEEGKYYLWDKSEIKQLLGENASDFCDAFNVTQAGHFEGKNILHKARAQNTNEVRNNDSDNEIKTLLASRANRIPPSTDKKILTDWNGLMINALSKASISLSGASTESLHRGFLAQAIKSFQFVAANVGEPKTGKLYHCYANETAYIDGRLDDYANMSLAAINLYGIIGEKTYLTYAEQWIKYVLKNFTHDSGAYYCNETNSNLILNPIDGIDNPTPSGNAIFAQALFRFGMITGEQDYIIKAENIIDAFGEQLQKNPFAMSGILNAYLSNQNLYCFAIEADPQIKTHIRETILKANIRDFVITDLSAIQKNDAIAQHHSLQDNNISDQSPCTIIICKAMQCYASIVNVSDLQIFLQNEFANDS